MPEIQTVTITAVIHILARPKATVRPRRIPVRHREAVAAVSGVVATAAAREAVAVAAAVIETYICSDGCRLCRN